MIKKIAECTKLALECSNLQMHADKASTAVEVEQLERKYAEKKMLLDILRKEVKEEIENRKVTCIICPEKKASINDANWIPISKRLPEVDKYGEAYVLVCLDDEFIATTTYVKSEGFELWAESGEVIAWMPLPGPYKVGD